MEKLDVMFEFIKQKEGEPSDKTYPKLQRIVAMRIKETDDDFGAAGNHYIVKCEMLSYAITGTSPNSVTPIVNEATCLVDKYEFDNFYKQQNAIIWL